MLPIDPPKWLTTSDMARRLGIHPKTLLRLRRQDFSPFNQGKHFRFGGITTAAPLQWQPAETELAFTSFSRVDPHRVEAFSCSRG